MHGYQNLVIDIQGFTAVVTINRESKLNALNAETLVDLKNVLDALAINDQVRGIVITGAGKKAFVAGADIEEFVGMSSEGARLRSLTVQQTVMNRIQFFAKPVIAAINGFALGGGLELALAAHIRVASDNAKLGLPEVSLGLIPGYGGTQRLTQLVGRSRALEMILTGDMISASEALNYGLLNYVVVQEDLIPKCIAILERTYLRSPQAIAKAINAVNGDSLNSAQGYENETELFAESFDTDEAKEGIAAFLEKRKPNF